MGMKLPGRADLIAALLDRLGTAHPAPAMFSNDEIIDWPDGALDQLVKDGVARPTNRADSIVCPGCEWLCHKPVIVRSTGAGLRAVIRCDEEPSHGPISVSLARLTRHEITAATIAATVARLLNLSAPKPSISGSIFGLGTINGRNGSRDVLLVAQDCSLLLVVGNQREPLAKFLIWGMSGFTIDRAMVVRLANRKDAVRRNSAGQTHVPDRTIQKRNSARTRSRDLALFRRAKEMRDAQNGSWTEIADEIASTQTVGARGRKGISPARVRRIIAKELQRERKNLRSKR